MNEAWHPPPGESRDREDDASSIQHGMNEAGHLQLVREEIEMESTGIQHGTNKVGHSQTVDSRDSNGKVSRYLTLDKQSQALTCW